MTARGLKLGPRGPSEKQIHADLRQARRRRRRNCRVRFRFGQQATHVVHFGVHQSFPALTKPKTFTSSS